MKVKDFIIGIRGNSKILVPPDFDDREEKLIPLLYAA